MVRQENVTSVWEKKSGESMRAEVCLQCRERERNMYNFKKNGINTGTLYGCEDNVL